MPSKSFYTFKSNLKQVDKLLLAFVDMRPPTRGRKHLDHFTRAALLFLCSSWEVYIEQIAKEAGELIVHKIEKPNNMPEIIKKTISKKVKLANHELSPFEFANDWRRYYCLVISEYTNKLNTPKKDKVLELLNKYVGISGDRINTEVPMLAQINKIVSVRGMIAHNVYAEDYLRKETVEEYYRVILQLVKEIELLLWNYIPKITDGRRPWQNTYN